MSKAESLAPPRLPKPESLEAKFKLLALLPCDERVRRKHSLVFGFILDWYHSKYGDALASVRHVAETVKERDPNGKGISVPHVHGALSDLVSWGYLHQTKGIGKRASRYVPNWALLSSSVTPVGNTKDDAPSVTPGVNTDVTPGVNTSNIGVTPVANEDPLTGPGHQTGALERGNECAAPTAPPMAGLSAATAGPAQGGFEELWQAYDYKKKKREAKAAYGKLAPDAGLHDVMVVAARAWRASWAAQNKPDAPRFHLHKWIEREEYECEPPSAYKPKERKAKRTELPENFPEVTDNDNDPLPIPLWARGRAQNWPDGSYPVKIVEADTHEDEYSDDRAIILKYRIVDGEHAGEEHEHVFWIVSSFSPENATKGTEHLNAIMKAVNQETLQETAELLDRFLRATVTGDSIEYSALSDKEFDAAADMDALTDPERIAA